VATATTHSRSSLVDAIASRIDAGKAMTTKQLAAELDVPVRDVRAAYHELAQQRGGDPLLKAAQQRFDRAAAINTERRR
jgi:hypothetical protein